jgi:hypothetical protein
VQTTRSECRIALLFVVLLSACTWAVASFNQPQAASALFSEFESVFYAKADLVRGSVGYEGLSEQSANGLRVPFADLLGALDSLGKPVSDELLGAADAVLVGAKDFRPPAGLGDVHSRLCYVILLRAGSRFDFAKAASKNHVISSAGNSTWKWTVKPTEGLREGQTFYATQAGHSYLLISNDAGDLTATALKLPSTNTQIASEVRDWENISHHAVWGYRRYHLVAVKYREAAGLTNVTPTAQALVFSLIRRTNLVFFASSRWTRALHKR